MFQNNKCRMHIDCKVCYIKVLLLCIIVMGVYVTTSSAQSFDSLYKPKLTGGISATNELYSVKGIANRSLPHNYSVSANLNLNVQNFNLPFSFYYSKQDNNYFQPFNQFGIRPSYKWVRVHMGYCNLNLSPFTLVGRTFLGAAVELTPTIKNNYQLKVIGFYGRLNRAVEIGPNSLSTPSFERRTYGASVGVVKEEDELSLTLFKAKDEENSINVVNNPDITPQNNIVVEALGKKRLLKKLFLSVDYAYSGLTQNTLSEGSTAPNILVDVLYNTQSTTMFGHSLSTALNYEISNYTIGVAYQTVGKDFTSTGINYMMTDFSQTTINAGARILKNTGFINASIGIQQNNISNTLFATNKRYIFNTDYSQSIKNNFRFTLNFANNTLSNKVTADAATDSLNFYMVTSNYGVNLSYGIGKKKTHMLSLFTSYQSGLQQLEYGLSKELTDFMFVTLSDNIRIKRLGLTVTPSFSYSKNSAGSNFVSYMGPILNVRKSLLGGKLNLMNSASVMQNVFNGSTGNILIKESLGVRYVLLKKHSLGAMYYLINQNNKNNNRPSFTEMKFSINYGFNF